MRTDGLLILSLLGLGVLLPILLAELFSSGTAAAPVPQTERTIEFSGYTWRVKRSTSPVGPGPNYFSDDNCNIWVDRDGRLHLKIMQRNGRWYCAEVICNRSLGYGTYRFYLDSRVDNLDPNVVVGLFTWSDQPAYTHREIDIEFSRWGNPNNANPGSYAVQPWDQPGRNLRFPVPAHVRQSNHSFLWQSNRIVFKSLRGHRATPPDSSYVIKEWTYSGANIPVPGDENPRINLWLFDGHAPAGEVELIVKRFEFVPGS